MPELILPPGVRRPAERSIERPIGRSVRSRHSRGDWSDYSFLGPEKRDPALRGQRQYRTYRVMRDEVPIVGVASAHLMMAAAKAKYKFTPAGDTAEAREDADTLREMMFGCLEGSLGELNQKLAMHALNGFAAVEWDGMLNESGMLCFRRYRDIPPETIPDFMFDMATTEVVSIIQRPYEALSPTQYTIPRWKLLYPKESGTTNSPRGRSLYRSVGSDALRWMQLAKLRQQASVANLRRRPIVWAPINKMRETFRKEVNDIALAKGDRLTATELNSALDARLSDALDVPLSIVDEPSPDPDYGLVFDSGTEMGESLDGTRPITIRTWDLKVLDEIDTDKAIAAMTSLSQDMARELHMIAFMRGDDGAGSYALANTQISDSWQWADSVISVGMAELQRLAQWLWTYNGMERDCPVLGVKESSFMSLLDEADLLLKAKMISVGPKGGLGEDDPAVIELLTRAGFKHKSKPRSAEEIADTEGGDGDGDRQQSE